MIVFGDRHHGSLYNSLSFLFEKRLGGQLYCPIGKEWVDKKYWRIAEIYNNAPETVEQYLGFTGTTEKDGVFYFKEPEYGMEHKAIKLDKFFGLPIDIVIASVPEHIASFSRLCEEHTNHPKLIVQIGNAWTWNEITSGGVSPKNIMASAILHDIPKDVNLITYHQEFDKKVYSYQPPRDTNQIASFINCFPTATIYKEDWPLFCATEAMMPEYRFKCFGGQGRDGGITGGERIAGQIVNSKYMWLTKNGGDGFGFMLHISAAMGRPLITKKKYYEGKLGGDLMVDGETCICIDDLNPVQIAEKIREMDTPIHYKYMCQKIHQEFEDLVDYDTEEVLIKNFLNKLK